MDFEPESRMKSHHAIGHAIKVLRKQRKLTQEDFGVVSSRTYLSTLERGLKNPTLEKLEEISQVLGVHPATLVLLSYTLLTSDVSEACDIIDSIGDEAKKLCGVLIENR